MKSLNTEPLHNYQTYQLDTLLGDTGTELVIKIFNSIITAEPKTLNNLKSIVKDEMQKMLVLNNIHSQHDELIFLDYFTLKVMVLINTGIYCRHNRTPDNLKSTLCKAIRNLSKKNIEELVQKD